jgi:pterin-4a-carbinolamine dehydratase
VASSRGRHLVNLLREPAVTASFVASFGARRFLARGRRAPGFFVYNKDNLYRLQYHGEHLPQPESKVSLSAQRDRFGVPLLDIDLRFSRADIDGIVRAHELWDAYLRRLGVGELVYGEGDLADAVAQRCGGGFHQIGTTRMAEDSRHGVVDGALRVHGVSNVFVASSSTFPTSGQANSTFMIVAFALRLVDHLAATFAGTERGGPRGERSAPRSSVGEVELLSVSAIEAGLVGLDWELAGGELVKVLRRRDFGEALEYVNLVGAAAEAAGHHPDIDIRWNTVTLRLSTHSLGGITDADLALAKTIDTLG